MGMRVHFLSIFSLLSILLAGCGVDAASAVLSSSPAACAPPISTPNPYNGLPEEWIWKPYDYVAKTGSLANETEYGQARYAAFQLLRRQTERWSNSIDIDVSVTEKIRITITYLSPQLLQLIEVNQLLRDRTDPIMGTGEFQNLVQTSLNKAAKMQGTIFLVTVYAVTSPDQGPMAIDLPVKNMVLTNAANETVRPIYSDQGFDGTLRLANNSYSGFVVYPMAVKNGEICHLFLEETPDRKITFSLSEIIINDKNKGNYTWVILYSPILDDGSPDENPNFVPPNPWQGYGSYAPSPQVPAPDLPADTYWELFSCHLWEQVTYDSLP